MKRKKPETLPTVDDERAALAAQRQALVDLKDQLAERVQAVQAREDELRAAIAVVRGGGELPPDIAALPPLDGTASGGSSPALAARLRALDEREALLARRERELADAVPLDRAGQDALAAELDARRAELDRVAGELEARRAELDRHAAEPLPGAELAARLAELKTAEQAFTKTREELAARAEAVAARERLVSEREKELRNGSGAAGTAKGSDLTELEARLRRLETTRASAAAQPQGFTGGLRRLERDGTRGRGA